VTRIAASVSEPARDRDALLRPNATLTRLAGDLASAAARLIDGDPRLFLTVTRRAERLSIGWWNPQPMLLALMEAPSERFAPHRSAEGALQLAGTALIAWLEGRWPPHALPAAIGVVTDGTGVAFAPERPDPEASGWFVHHAAGGGRLRPIVPFDPVGPCALLTASEPIPVLH
jgi:hypothetical protein